MTRDEGRFHRIGCGLRTVGGSFEDREGANEAKKLTERRNTELRSRTNELVGFNGFDLPCPT